MSSDGRPVRTMRRIAEDLAVVDAAVCVTSAIDTIRGFNSATGRTVDPGIEKLLAEKTDAEICKDLLKRTCQAGQHLLMTRILTEGIIQRLPLVYTRQSMNLSFLRYERGIYLVVAWVKLEDGLKDERLYVGSGRGKAGMRGRGLNHTSHTYRLQILDKSASEVYEFLELPGCHVDVYCLAAWPESSEGIKASDTSDILLAEAVFIGLLDLSARSALRPLLVSNGLLPNSKNYKGLNIASGLEPTYAGYLANTSVRDGAFMDDNELAAESEEDRINYAAMFESDRIEMQDNFESWFQKTVESIKAREAETQRKKSENVKLQQEIWRNEKPDEHNTAQKKAKAAQAKIGLDTFLANGRTRNVVTRHHRRFNIKGMTFHVPKRFMTTGGGDVTLKLVVLDAEDSSLENSFGGKYRVIFQGNGVTGPYTKKDFSKGSSTETEIVEGFDRWFREHREAGTFAPTGRALKRARSLVFDSDDDDVEAEDYRSRNTDEMSAKTYSTSNSGLSISAKNPPREKDVLQLPSESTTFDPSMSAKTSPLKEISGNIPRVTTVIKTRAQSHKQKLAREGLMAASKGRSTPAAEKVENISSDDEIDWSRPGY